VGHGFSTNGDYLAFLEGTDERVSLTRGPITTSFAHFNVPGAGPGGENSEKFHTIEDNGVPRAFASLLGFGLPLVRSLTKGHPSRFFVLVTLVRWAFERLRRQITAFLTNARERQREFWSEDEYTANMMCIAAMGRDQAKGVFRLGRRPFETPLRLERSDGIPFFKDPIYKDIGDTLKRFADRLVTKRTPPTFLNPFLTKTADALKARAIGLSHPLGGCRMARAPSDGVADEFGRVFDTRAPGAIHRGLYVADGSIVPTALGVNPSLTISALSLRIADQLVKDLPKAGPPGP
jgi:cholesterol oxidase